MSEVAWIDALPHPLTARETWYQFVSRHRGPDLIPTLCHEEALTPFGACRLCGVEVGPSPDGPWKIVAACHTPALAGQYLRTASPRLERLRRHLLELLVSAYPEAAQTPAPGHRPTQFQALLARYGVQSSRFGRHPSQAQPDLSHPYLRFDAAQCVHCHRCIRACDEVQGSLVLAMHGRGHRSRVIRSLDQDFRQSDCVSCGRCVQSCPTNALSDRYQAKTLDAERRVRTTCTYCGVGCQLEVLVQDGTIRAIQGAEGAVNAGHTCVKGRYAFAYQAHPDRLRTPLIREQGQLKPATWDQALDLIARRLQDIRAARGPDAIAGISSARCTNEENYLMQKLLRAVIGTNNIDGCARVCHAPTAFGMQQTLGTGAATNSIAEIPLADCLLVMGANPSEAHPVTGAKIKQRAMQGVPLILIDPRAIDLARYAAVHLQPRPGTNVALLNLLLWELLDQGLANQDFIARRTQGFEDFQAAIRAQDPEQLAAICGVPRPLVRQAAGLYGRAQRAMAFHGLGVTEHYQGSKTVMLLTALALASGQVGRPGTGINPLRGQNNVQGAADMGVQPHQGPGYLDVRDPEARARHTQLYGRELPAEPGLKIPEMFAAARDGRLKALWIMGEDLLQTDPNSCEVRFSLSRLEFLVVQELFMTETAAVADVVLPAASHFEKAGTFTNGERRIQRVNPVLDPLPGTLADGQIVVEVMRRLGYPQPDYDPPSLLAEIAQAVPFFAGVTWDRLGDNGLQWPVRPDGTGTQILHQDQFQRGLGRFLHFPFVETPELQDGRDQYPLILTTGRLLAHYNCGSMTRRTPNRDLVDRDLLLINPQDAAAHAISDGDRVQVRSRRGATHLEARLSDQLQPGVLFTTFHYPEVAINHLTSGIFDQDSMTPEYKVVAVAIEKQPLMG